jgi:Ala-tRNA(Pro) deacylase
MEPAEKVFAKLDELGISYTKTDHPPVYTVEEARKYWTDMKGAHTKNLFLRNKKATKHYLVIIEHAKRLDIKRLQRTIGSSSLSFASDRRLHEYLGLTPGAVSAFGIINDDSNAVEVIVDKDLLRFETINFHPNVNTATLTIAISDFKRFLEKSGNKVTYTTIEA